MVDLKLCRVLTQSREITLATIIRLKKKKRYDHYEDFQRCFKKVGSRIHILFVLKHLSMSRRLHTPLNDFLFSPNSKVIREVSQESFGQDACGCVIFFCVKLKRHCPEIKETSSMHFTHSKCVCCFRNKTTTKKKRKEKKTTQN